MSVFRRFKLPQLLRKHKSDGNSIVDIPRFDCNALAVKERLGQGSFGDVYTVDYKGPGAHFSKVPRLFGRISGDIILFVSSKRRRLEARNVAVIFIFIPFTTYKKTSFKE